MFFLWISKRRGDKMKDYIFTSESVTEGHPDFYGKVFHTL